MTSRVWPGGAGDDTRWMAGALAVSAFPISAAVALAGPAVGLALVGAVVVFGLLVVFDRDGRRSVSAWLFITAFVSPWIGVRVAGVFVAASALLALLVLGRLVASRVRVRLSAVDLVLLAFVLVAIISVAVYSTPLVVFREVILLWLIPYAVGRYAPRQVGVVLLAVGLAAAAMSIFEFVSGTNIFASINSATNLTQDVWNGQQVRGADVRSEASFGHPIALGATIVLAVPWAMSAGRYRWVMLGVLALGVGATVSRGPLIALMVAIALSALVQADRRHRATSVALSGVLVLSIAATLYFIASGSAANQLEGSDDYRILTVQRTIDSLRFIGLAQDVRLDSDTGSLTFSGIYTVDNAFLLISLEYGVLAGLLLLVPVLAAVWAVIRRSATIPTIALVSQVPVIAVTAPITQWQVFLFFVAGMAVSAQASARRERLSPEMVHSLPDHELRDGRVGS